MLNKTNRGIKRMDLVPRVRAVLWNDRWELFYNTILTVLAGRMSVGILEEQGIRPPYIFQIPTHSILDSTLADWFYALYVSVSVLSQMSIIRLLPVLNTSATGRNAIDGIVVFGAIVYALLMAFNFFMGTNILDSGITGPVGFLVRIALYLFDWFLTFFLINVCSLRINANHEVVWPAAVLLIKTLLVHRLLA